MKTAVKILGGVVVLAVVAIVGWHYYQMHRARQAGLLTENITHDGDNWKADFTARIPAPEQTVFDAIKNVETTHSDQVKAVRVVSQSGNKKTVDMDIAGPADKRSPPSSHSSTCPTRKRSSTTPSTIRCSIPRPFTSSATKARALHRLPPNHAYAAVVAGS